MKTLFYTLVLLALLAGCKKETLPENKTNPAPDFPGCWSAVNGDYYDLIISAPTPDSYSLDLGQDCEPVNHVYAEVYLDGEVLVIDNGSDVYTCEIVSDTLSYKYGTEEIKFTKN